MKNKILFLISVIVTLVFLVSCAPKELTDEELDAELAKLTPEEKAELLKDLETKESGALAGQATKYRSLPKDSRLRYVPTTKLVAKMKSQLPTDYTNPPSPIPTAPPNSTVCGNGVKEGSEECDDGNAANDDSCTTTCTSTGLKAALIIESAEYSVDSTNQNVLVKATVKNLGNAATGNGFDIGFTQLTVSGQPATNQPASALAVGESAIVSVTLKSYCPSPAAGHYISIFADPGSKVVETSKADNSYSLTYFCGSVCLEQNGCVCGDGLKNSTEQCDDSNVVNGDGCSSECKTEAPKPNSPPYFTGMDNATSEAGGYPTFTLEATDPDGDTLTYSAVLSSGIVDADFVLNSNTGFTGWHVPLGQAPGNYLVKYTVSDGKGGSASKEGKFTVTVS